MEIATRATMNFNEHAQQCGQCADVVKRFPDLNLFDHQLCPVGQVLFRTPQETPARQELLPCPLLGHEPLGTSNSFGPGPYVSVSGAPDAIQFYGVVCPGCCSTAYCASRERAVELWNTRPNGQDKENGLPASKNALERDSEQSSPIPASSATPETIRISLPALRAVILAALDSRTWLLYEQIRKGHILWSEDKANEERLRFCDEIEHRLREATERRVNERIYR